MSLTANFDKQLKSKYGHNVRVWQCILRIDGNCLGYHQNINGRDVRSLNFKYTYVKVQNNGTTFLRERLPER